MLAVVKEHLGPGFSVKEVPYPVLRDTDVIIKVRSVGICGSDGPILAGTRPVPYPLTPGHEFSGDVVEVGKAVKNLKVGDRVTPCIVIGCGDCDMCIEGKEVLCDELVETGIHVDGAMAEYVRVPAKVCRKMRDTTTYDQGASVDPIASAYRTVKASGITSKDVCCVYGAGPIGLYAVQLIKLRGVKTVICLDTDAGAQRLELAKELGADYTINVSHEDPVERVREILKIAQEPVSLETPIGEEEDSHLGDFIPDEDASEPSEAASFTLLKEQLVEVLSTLTPREEKVLKLRFGIEDGRTRTLEEVGKEFNVTRERIRQIEAKALRKLRHPSRSKKLKDFLN